MSNCIFCSILAGELPAAVVDRNEHCLVIMDAYPLRPGHVLIISNTHAPLMTDLSAAERGALTEMGNRIALAMRKADPDCAGINWGINDGKVAGQHVPHVHLHLIPRRNGDFGALAAAFAKRPLAMLRKPDIGRLESDAARLRACL